MNLDRWLKMQTQKAKPFYLISIPKIFFVFTGNWKKIGKLTETVTKKTWKILNAYW